MSVEHVLTATPDVKEELWHWPLDVARYDRCPDLRPDERTSIARIARRVRPGAEWPQRIRCVLGRLRLPLEDAMAYLDVCDRTQRSALRILVLEMHRRQKAFWGWSQGQWAEMLCPSAAEFLSRHTSEHDCRSNLVAFGYLLNLFDDFNALGPFRRSTLAENIFGAVRLARAFGRVIEAIRRCGYQSHKAHGESIRQCPLGRHYACLARTGAQLQHDAENDRLHLHNFTCLGGSGYPHTTTRLWLAKRQELESRLGDTRRRQ
jgi:hypothetical protein